MPDFVNITDHEVDVYATAGWPDTLRVLPGQTITAPGELADEQPEDAYLIGTGDDARLWPKSQWQLKEAPKAPAKAAKTDPAQAAQSKETP